MKIWIKIIAMMIISINGAYSQNKVGFRLHGNIKGLKDNSVVYLVLDNDTVSETKSIGSKFKFTGFVVGEANWYVLKLDTFINKVVKNSASNALWLSNSNLIIEGSADGWKKLKLKGSEPHDEYTQVSIFSNSNKPLKGDNAELKMKKIELVNSYILKFIEDHPNSLYISDLIIKATNILNEDGLNAAYTNLTDRAKRSYFGGKLATILAGTRARKDMNKSGIISDFNISGIDGKKKSILEIASGSKYTLIDFWASWCSPCRAAIPKLREAFEKYNHKGFNIVGVSIDKNELEWKRAVTEDKTSWTQGLDNNEISGQNIFNLIGIPAYILIDSKGNIIQADYASKSKIVQVRKYKDKTIDHNLNEIIEVLLKEDESK